MPLQGKKREGKRRKIKPQHLLAHARERKKEKEK
jgi:hypothetical protein